MTYLLLSLLSSVGIFLFFKFFHLKKVSLLKAVTANYLSCTLTGLIYHFDSISQVRLNDLSWFPYALVMGMVFFFTFSLMGRTTALNGVTAASMATKLSLVFPTLISIVILKTTSTSIFLWIALAISIPAIVLASIKSKNKEISNSGLLLPLAVFILSGAIDGGINILNYSFHENPSFVHFPGVVFFLAAVTGFSYHLVKGSRISHWGDKWVWVGGFGLGIANYFSIEFLLRGLQHFDNDGALVFPFLNVAIIVLSSMAGVSFFKERLSNLNLVGLGLSIICLCLLIFAGLNG